MKITKLPLHLPSIADDAASDRKAGDHISGIIKYVLQKLDPAKYGDVSEEMKDRVLWELGLTWEEWSLSRRFWKRILRRKYPKLAFKQVQVRKDGIWGTCDQVQLPDDTRVYIVECKLTRISMRNEIDSAKFWHWLVQLKAYLHMWGGRDGLLLVAFLNGDYKPMRVVLEAYKIRFTRQELHENWQMLVTTRDEMVVERRKNELYQRDVELKRLKKLKRMRHERKRLQTAA